MQNPGAGWLFTMTASMSNTTACIHEPVCGWTEASNSDFPLCGQAGPGSSGALFRSWRRRSGLMNTKIVLNPVALGGRTIFDGIKERLPLKLTKDADIHQQECRSMLRADCVSASIWLASFTGHTVCLAD
jgi:hypothetical protein